MVASVASDTSVMSTCPPSIGIEGLNVLVLTEVKMGTEKLKRNHGQEANQQGRLWEESTAEGGT